MASQIVHKNPTMAYPATYRIRISGHLDVNWSDRLAGMTITTTGGKNTPNMTLLEGSLTDQAALSGILNTLHDLNYNLISVENLDEPKAPGRQTL